MKMRLSRISPYLTLTTHYYLDNDKDIFLHLNDFAKYLWQELNLPQEDGEHWIEITLQENN